jgi:sugar/nucleoside kinase (ribokinase family)
VVDPTGAGDSFAGGMMGYIAKTGDTKLETLKRALTYGTVIASINVEGFSLERFQKTVLRDVDERYEKFRQMMMF